MKIISIHANKTGSWYFFGFFSKFFPPHPGVIHVLTFASCFFFVDRLCFLSIACVFIRPLYVGDCVNHRSHVLVRVHCTRVCVHSWGEDWQTNCSLQGMACLRKRKKWTFKIVLNIQVKYLYKLTSFFNEFGVMAESWRVTWFFHLFQLCGRSVDLREKHWFYTNESRKDHIFERTAD